LALTTAVAILGPFAADAAVCYRLAEAVALLRFLLDDSGRKAGSGGPPGNDPAFA
jgi:hypothetical protein